MKSSKAFIKQEFSPVIWVSLILVGYAIIFFCNVTRPHWLFVGDTLNNFGVYYYQYAGFARGEYPLWNPLVRSGQPEIIHQGMQLASPISNVVMLISVLSGMQNVVLSYAVCIFVYIVLYVIGVYLLISSWTNNRYAGVFASFLAIGSSAVFFSTFHVSFILMVHAVPWILYSLMMYFRSFQFKYCVIFALACNSLLYSYEFFMGAAYMVMLLVALALFYRREISEVVHTLKRIPLRHISVLGIILVVMMLPNIFIFMELREKFLVFSRASEIHITEQYTLAFQNTFGGKHFSLPVIFSGFWASLFTGVFRNTYNSLRHYVGPLAFPFICLTLFSRKRIIWCIALSGILIVMLAGDIFPVNLLLKLPIFSLIGNTHFLLQFFLFTLILLAGFGFDILVKEKNRKIFNGAAIFLIVISLGVLFSRFISSTYNDGALGITIFALSGSLLLINFCPPKFFMSYFLSLTLLTVLVSIGWMHRLPLVGHISHNPVIDLVSHRSDHALQFRYERPIDIETIKLANEETASFGYDEFSSYVTLKDNAYQTAKGREGGLSSYPLLKNYYLFLLLPGHEEMMSKKFFFFPKSYLSDDPKQMIVFRDAPHLFAAMLAKGAGIVDQLEMPDISLGPFHPESPRRLSNKASKNKFDIKVTEYRANSIRTTVSVKKPGLLMYTDLWDKGWRVRVDGKEAPLRKVFHTFKGVELPAGTHEVSFYYHNKLFFFIMLMNVIFIVGILWLTVYSLQSRRGISK